MMTFFTLFMGQPSYTNIGLLHCENKCSTR